MYFGLIVGMDAIFASVLFYATVIFIFSFFSPENHGSSTSSTIFKLAPFSIMVHLIFLLLNGLQLQHVAMIFNAITWCFRILFGVHLLISKSENRNTYYTLYFRLWWLLLCNLYLKFKYNLKVSIVNTNKIYVFFSIFHDYLNFTRKYYAATV